jgi:pimeloyl-ACP methyl ester carboxylesterase
MKSLYLPEYKTHLRYFDLPGDEPACVYLHGLGCAASSDFPPVAARPPLNRQRSLLVDFLGFGYSDRPADFSCSLEDHARTAALLLDHLNLKGCALIGHSMGGSVAITLAARRPDLASALVAAEPNLDPGVGTLSVQIASFSEADYVASGHHKILRAAVLEGLRGDASMAAYAASFSLADPLATHRSAVGLLRGTEPSMRQNLYRLALPRACVFGQRNLPDPDETILPQKGVDILVIPGAGHAMMEDKPDAFAEIIGGWLARLG